MGVDDLGGYIDNVNNKVQFHQFDLDNSKLEKLFESTRPDIVYHFGHMRQGLSLMRNYNYKNNLMSTSK